MKTIFTLLSSLLLSVTLFANNSKNKSMVLVKSVDNAEIRVVMDGKLFEPNSNSLVISNVNAGRHNIKVYRQQRSGLFNRLNQRFELLYSSSLQVGNRTQLFITIDRNGRIEIAENSVQRNNGRFNDRSSRNFDYMQDGIYGQYDGGYAHIQGMNQRDFDRVMDNISKEWLESNKLKSATQVARTHHLSTDQVKEMMRFFQFENNKVEVARQAYINVVDKWNFREVYTLLSFQASKNELEKLIVRR